MRAVYSPDAETDLKGLFFGQLEQGYFVEVGANHPHYGSQTFDLEQRGWIGVLVEPQPDLADDLRRQRSAKVFAEACSSRRNSGRNMTLNLAGGHSSFNPKLNLAEVKPHGTIEVPARTLNEILIEAAAPRIDFISIDVEGHELDVLDGFELTRWKPRLILIEDLLLHLRLHRYLSRRGYRLLRRTGINNWYVPADTLPRLGLDGRWQLFNKLYLGTPFRRVRMAWRRRHTVPQFVVSQQK
ncbi:MAG: FkbM family methyltransferase [Xanthobacteraceae bacterium]|jgi:FkbM family methyltransferase